MWLPASKVRADFKLCLVGWWSMTEVCPQIQSIWTWEERFQCKAIPGDKRLGSCYDDSRIGDDRVTAAAWMMLFRSWVESVHSRVDFPPSPINLLTSSGSSNGWCQFLLLALKKKTPLPHLYERNCSSRKGYNKNAKWLWKGAHTKTMQLIRIFLFFNSKLKKAFAKWFPFYLFMFYEDKWKSAMSGICFSKRQGCLRVFVIPEHSPSPSILAKSRCNFFRDNAKQDWTITQLLSLCTIS